MSGTGNSPAGSPQHAPGWRLVGHVPNRYPYDPAAPEETSFADFYFFGQGAAVRCGA